MGDVNHVYVASTLQEAACPSTAVIAAYPRLLYIGTIIALLYRMVWAAQQTLQVTRKQLSAVFKQQANSLIHSPEPDG